MKIYQYNGKCNVSGANIRKIREREGMSQEQLAAKIQLMGVPMVQKAISRIETGERVVADYEMMLIAQIFGADVKDLLD